MSHYKTFTQAILEELKILCTPIEKVENHLFNINTLGLPFLNFFKKDYI